MKADISPIVCLYIFWGWVGGKLWGWSSTDGHVFFFGSASSQMKSLLLPLGCSSHSRCPIFLQHCALRRFEDWRPCCWLQWDFPSSRRLKESVRGVRIKPPPSRRLRIKTEPCRANSSQGWIAVIMQRFHRSCEANQEVPSQTNTSTCLLQFSYKSSAIVQLWSLISRS